MSRTWLQFLLIGIDDLGAVVFFNRPGITISSLCKLAMAGEDAPLKLYPWQRKVLLWLGARLGHVHCDAAALADWERNKANVAMLAPK
jgi:hypothetical protein